MTMPTSLRNSVANAPDYSECDLANADMRNCVMNGGTLAGADLRGADMRNGTFNMTSFRDVDMRGADVRNAVFNGCDMTGAQTDGVDARNAVGFRPSVPKRRRTEEASEHETPKTGRRGRSTGDAPVREKAPMASVLHRGKASSSQGVTRPSSEQKDDGKKGHGPSKTKK
jgi:hypothetical protein